VTFGSLSAAVGHDLGEWIGEVIREIGIDHHHIEEFGKPGLGLVIVIATILYLVKKSDNEN
jgi:hypothetical protein